MRSPAPGGGRQGWRPVARQGPVHAGMAVSPWCNLLHDKVRCLITLAGTVAIVLLLQADVPGSRRACQIDRTDADVGGGAATRPTSTGRLFPSVRNKVCPPRAGRGKTLISAGILRLPGGGTEQVEIIGYHPPPRPGPGEPSAWGEPPIPGGDAWSVRRGQRHHRRVRSASWGLGRAEDRDQGTRCGHRDDSRHPFPTTAPYFGVLRHGQELVAYIGERTLVFVLARSRRCPSSLSAGRASSQRGRLTKAEYSRRTMVYWTIQTGWIGFP